MRRCETVFARTIFPLVFASPIAATIVRSGGATAVHGIFQHANPPLRWRRIQTDAARLRAS